MNARVAASSLPTPRNQFDRGGQPQAKAGLAVNGSQSDGLGLTNTVRDGLIRAFGSLKSAAITMDIDQGQLTRELQNGAFKFERLERLSASEKAIVIGLLHEVYGPLASSPLAQARRLIRDGRALLDQLDQAVEAMAS